MRCLFNTGSKDVGKFSLSSDLQGLEVKGSLEKEGVVGVKGMSSDKSETDVDELIGVLTADTEADERVGVTGSEARE